MNTSTIELICAQCGEEFPHTPEPLPAEVRQPLPGLCESCRIIREDAADTEREQAKLARRKERLSAWPRLALGALYASTDIQHPGMDKRAVQAALAWRPGTRGLGVVGPARRGKTRAIHLALQRAWEVGRSCLAVREVDFADWAEEAAFGSMAKKRVAKEKLRDAANVGVLLFDDVGKARFSAVMAEAMYALLDRRSISGLPVLWSAQAGGEWLEAKYGPDHGPAIASRLGVEFCTVVVLQ